MLTVLLALALPLLSPFDLRASDALAAPPPVTAIAGSLSLEARLERSLVHTSAAQIHALVKLTAADGVAAERRPVNLALVLDRSGSMAGRKIEDARAAALALVGQLQDGDRVTLVSYGSDVRVDVPPTVLDAAARLEVTRAIVRIRHGGRTNLAGGLKVAYHQLAPHRDADRVTRVVLVSDGLANVGTTQPRLLAALARADWQEGTVTTTLGLGVDYNEDLMTELAVHGGGGFYHVSRSEQLAGVLSDELAHMQATVARQATLELTLPEGVRVRAVHGHAVAQEGRTVLVTLGDLSAGQSRSILWALELPHAQLGAQPLGEIVLHYTDARDGQRRAARGGAMQVTWTGDRTASEASVDPEVAARMAELQLAAAMATAADHMAAGDLDQAQQVLGAATRRARSNAAGFGAVGQPLADEAAAAEAMLDDVKKAPASPKARRELAKQGKAKAFEMSRQ